MLELGLKGDKLMTVFECTGINSYIRDSVITQDYKPFTMEDSQAPPQLLAKAMTSSDTPLGLHAVTVSPPV